MLNFLKKINWQEKQKDYLSVYERYEVLNKINSPIISIIVISWRLHPDNLKSFEILAKQRNQNFELIFVNNGASKSEFAPLMPYIDKYIKLNTNTGAYLARNIGSIFAESPILFFLEDDGIPEEDIIKKHLEVYDKYEIIAARGVYKFKTNNPVNKGVCHYFLGDNPFPIYADLEGNTTYKADPFYKVGGWDDDIRFGGGGVDLSIRLLQVEPERRKQIYTPGPVIYHDYAKDKEHLAHKLGKQKKSRERLLTIHPNWDEFLVSWRKFEGDASSIIPTQKELQLSENFSEPLISICIPTYNNVDLFEKTLNSALLQDYENFEIVVVDDKSSTDIKQIIKNINSKKINCFDKELTNVPAARNLCIQKSNGEYILWLDGGDELNVNALSTYNLYLNLKKGIDILSCNNEYLQEDNNDKKRNSFEDFSEQIPPFEFLLASPISDKGTLVKKELYSKVGNYNLEFIKEYNYEFWARVIKSANFFHCPEFLLIHHLQEYETLPENIPSDLNSNDGLKIADSIISANSREQVFTHINWGKISESDRTKIEAQIDFVYAKVYSNWNDFNKAKLFAEKSILAEKNEEVQRFINDLPPINISNSAKVENKENMGKTIQQTIDDKENPTVSVLMTTYNRRETLGDAIKSVVNQTYKNWNLVLINDGGEEVKDIVELFNDPRIKYFSTENKGKAAALNHAIENSNSKYIAYLDDDDKFYPNHLEVLVTYLEVNPEFQFVHSIAEEVSLVENNHEWSESGRTILYKENVSSLMLRDKNYIPNLCAVHVRSLFAKAGLYDESLKVLIDWDMYRRLALVSEPKFIDMVTAEYFRRIKPNNSAANQITGLFYTDPVNYYKNRLRITSKEYHLDEISNVNCLVIEINSENKDDATFFVAKYNNLKQHINADLLLVINTPIDNKLLDSITYAERVGGLVLWNDGELNQKELINRTIKNSNCKNHIYFDSLNDYNLENQIDGFNIEKELIHFSSRIKKIFPKEFSKPLVQNNDRTATKSVSIVIPTFNNWELTEKCIDAIYKSKNSISFEVIIVDNNSTDKTRSQLEKYEKKYKNLKVILNEENLGFAKANNIGVKTSKNELILFLNNDTESKDNWLDEIVKILNSDEKVGIVGAKLLYPETNLIQHAGVVIDDKPHKIFPFHIFHNKPHDYALANIVQEYQAVTGACLLIRKDLFERVNQFDEGFVNGYEDVDLCFKVRKNGYKILYAPKSVVVHHESKTEGRFNNVDHNVNLLHEKWETEIVKDNLMEMFKPKISIIIPVYNQLNYTKECITSIKEFTNTSYEIIIINNASTDGTAEYLANHEDCVTISNQENLGYPKAINQGIRVAKGDDIILLNNDTIVTKGWLERLLKVKDSNNSVGIVGVYSNSISGFQLDKSANYKTIKEMHNYAGICSKTREYAWIEYPRVAFVCVLISRELINNIGGLDERFSPGNFEDDDFCLRAQMTGYKTVVATDVFIHHHGSVSFKADGEDKYAKRIETNKQKFIDKWGADPEEIWIKGTKPNKKELYFSINKDLFTQHIERSFTNVDENEHQLAIENFEIAIANFKDSDRIGFENLALDELIVILGNIYFATNNLEKAKETFEAALNENPNSSSACQGLGEIFQSIEEFEAAKMMFEWAVKNDEKNKIALQKLVTLNKSLGLDENDFSLSEE